MEHSSAMIKHYDEPNYSEDLITQESLSDDPIEEDECPNCNEIHTTEQYADMFQCVMRDQIIRDPFDPFDLSDDEFDQLVTDLIQRRNRTFHIQKILTQIQKSNIHCAELKNQIEFDRAQKTINQQFKDCETRSASKPVSKQRLYERPDDGQNMYLQQHYQYMIEQINNKALKLQNSFDETYKLLKGISTKKNKNV